MNNKLLFYKAIIWQIIGSIWISLLSYFWFGSWGKSILFSIVVMIISIFIYVLYEVVWNNITNKNKKSK